MTKIRPRFSVLALLVTVVGIAIVLAIYRYLNPQPPYPVAMAVTPRIQYSHAFGNEYISEIDAEAIRRAPRWYRTNPNPPLSANDAIVRAERYRKQLIDNKKLKNGVDIYENWAFAGAKLMLYYEKEGLWFWLIDYKHTIPTDPPNEIQLIVLMDGKVIDPLIVPDTVESPSVPRDTPLGSHSLGIENLRIYDLPTDARPGGLFVLHLDRKPEQVLSITGDEVLALYDKARTNDSENGIPKIEVPSSSEAGCTVLIARIPGSSHSEIYTTIAGITKFEMLGNFITIEGYCEFDGPADHYPVPSAIYVIAAVPVWPGRYQAVIKMKPRGEVYEENKLGPQWLPTLSPIAFEFDVARKTLSNQEPK